MKTYKITINGKEIVCKENETVLDASVRQVGGIFIGCKGGGCGMCKVKVSAGESTDGVSSKSVLSDEEYRDGYRLACQIKPTTDMVIEPCRETNKILK